MENYDTKQSKLSPPWNILASKIRVLFEQDNQITVSDCVPDEDSEGNYKIDITVDNIYKLQAIKILIPSKVTIGNVEVKINMDKSEESSYIDLTKDTVDILFKDNPIYKETIGIENTLTHQMQYYALFNKEVLQYFADDLESPWGIQSNLAENIARDIFIPDEKFISYLSFSTNKE